MKVTGKIIKFMDKANLQEKMEIHIKGIGLKIIYKDMVLQCKATVIALKVHGNKTKEMDKAYISGMMEIDTLEIGKRMSDLVKVNFGGLMVIFMMVNG